MRKEFLALLIGFLENQTTLINKIWDEIDSAEPSDREKTSHLGYLLHNLYGALEDLFQEVAKTFENRIEDPLRYHRELLSRMRLHIPGIRPEMLTDKSFQILNELRAFRHVFRHAYGYELDPQRVRQLKQKLKRERKRIRDDLKTFTCFIEDTLNKAGHGRESS